MTVRIEQIPVDPVPWQEFSVVLNGQNCVISLRQIAERLYADLTVGDTPIFTGRICQNGTAVNLYNDKDFSGKLVFADLLGNENPQYEGLGTRWVLLYGYDDGN